MNRRTPNQKMPEHLNFPVFIPSLSCGPFAPTHWMSHRWPLLLSVLLSATGLSYSPWVAAAGSSTKTSSQTLSSITTSGPGAECNALMKSIQGVAKNAVPKKTIEIPYESTDTSSKSRMPRVITIHLTKKELEKIEEKAMQMAEKAWRLTYTNPQKVIDSLEEQDLNILLGAKGELLLDSMNQELLKLLETQRDDGSPTGNLLTDPSHLVEQFSHVIRDLQHQIDSYIEEGNKTGVMANTGRQFKRAFTTLTGMFRNDTDSQDPRTKDALISSINGLIETTKQQTEELKKTKFRLEQAKDIIEKGDDSYRKAYLETDFQYQYFQMVHQGITDESIEVPDAQKQLMLEAVDELLTRLAKRKTDLLTMMVKNRITSDNFDILNKFIKNSITNAGRVLYVFINSRVSSIITGQAQNAALAYQNSALKLADEMNKNEQRTREVNEKISENNRRLDGPIIDINELKATQLQLAAIKEEYKNTDRILLKMSEAQQNLLGILTEQERSSSPGSYQFSGSEAEALESPQDQTEESSNRFQAIKANSRQGQL